VQCSHTHTFPSLPSRFTPYSWTHFFKDVWNASMSSRIILQTDDLRHLKALVRLLLPSPLLCPCIIEIIDIFLKVALILLVHGTPSPSSPPNHIKTTVTDGVRTDFNCQAHHQHQHDMVLLHSRQDWCWSRRFLLLRSLASFLLFFFFWKRANFGCGGRTISVGLIYPAPFRTLFSTYQWRQ